MTSPSPSRRDLERKIDGLEKSDDDPDPPDDVFLDELKDESCPPGTPSIAEMLSGVAETQLLVDVRDGDDLDAETVELETPRSRNNRIQAQRLIDLGRTFGVEMSRGEAGSATIFLVDHDLAGNPFALGTGTAKTLGESADATVYAKREAMEDIVERTDWHDDYQIGEDKAGHKFLQLDE